MEPKVHEVALTEVAVSPAARAAYMTAGMALFALGLVGLVVPVMPTTVFMIFAAACFARCSPRLEAWLVNHRHFGPHIREWREHKSIPLGLKVFICSMAVGSALLTWLVLQAKFWVVAIAATIAALTIAAMLWIPTRHRSRTGPH